MVVLYNDFCKQVMPLYGACIYVRMVSKISNIDPKHRRDDGCNGD